MELKNKLNRILEQDKNEKDVSNRVLTVYIDEVVKNYNRREKLEDAIEGLRNGDALSKTIPNNDYTVSENYDFRKIGDEAVDKWFYLFEELDKYSLLKEEDKDIIYSNYERYFDKDRSNFDKIFNSDKVLKFHNKDCHLEDIFDIDCNKGFFYLFNRDLEDLDYEDIKDMAKSLNIDHNRDKKELVELINNYYKNKDEVKNVIYKDYNSIKKEAEKLGIDPDKNKDELIKQIKERGKESMIYPDYEDLKERAEEVGVDPNQDKKEIVKKMKEYYENKKRPEEIVDLDYDGLQEEAEKLGIDSSDKDKDELITDIINKNYDIREINPDNYKLTIGIIPNKDMENSYNAKINIPGAVNKYGSSHNHFIVREMFDVGDRFKDEKGEYEIIDIEKGGDYVFTVEYDNSVVVEKDVKELNDSEILTEKDYNTSDVLYNILTDLEEILGVTTKKLVNSNTVYSKQYEVPEEVDSLVMKFYSLTKEFKEKYPNISMYYDPEVFSGLTLKINNEDEEDKNYNITFDIKGKSWDIDKRIMKIEDTGHTDESDIELDKVVEIDDLIKDVKEYHKQWVKYGWDFEKYDEKYQRYQSNYAFIGKKENESEEIEDDTKDINDLDIDLLEDNDLL